MRPMRARHSRPTPTCSENTSSTGALRVASGSHAACLADARRIRGCMLGMGEHGSADGGGVMTH